VNGGKGMGMGEEVRERGRDVASMTSGDFGTSRKDRVAERFLPKFTESDMSHMTMA